MAGNAFKRFNKPKRGANPKGGPPETLHKGPAHGWKEGTSGNPGGVPVYRYEALQRFCQKLLQFVEANSPEAYRIAIEARIEATRIVAAKATDPKHPEQLEALKVLNEMDKEARVYALGHVPKEANINVNSNSLVKVRPVDLPGMITELTIFEKRTQMIHAVMEEERAELIEAVATTAEPNGETVQ